MDIEWARDGDDGRLYMLQARPETVQQPAGPGRVERYRLKEKGKVLARDARSATRSARARCASSATSGEMDNVREGDVLVTDMTDPDWEPMMKLRGGDRHQPWRAHLPRGDHRARAGHPGGGRLRQRDRVDQRGQAVTVSCAEGDGGMSTTGASTTRSRRRLTAMPPVAVQAHDERGQSRIAPSTSAACPTTAWGSRGWNSSSTA